MTRLDSTATSLSGIANQARAFLSQLQAPLAAAGVSGLRIRHAMEDLSTALEDITAAKGKIAMLTGDATRTTAYKLDQAKHLVGSSYADATRAALDLGSAIDAARGKLASSILPGKPGGPIDPMMAFTASEVAKSLEHAGGPAEVVTLASGMLADALSVDDKAMAYIITGPAMHLVYKRLHVNMPMLMAAFADVLAKSDAQPSDPGAALLPILQMGGSGTLRSLVDTARIAIIHDQEAYNAWLVTSARAGAMIGVWEQGGIPLA